MCSDCQTSCRGSDQHLCQAGEASVFHFVAWNLCAGRPRALRQHHSLGRLGEAHSQPGAGECYSVGVLTEMFQVLAAVENYPDSVFLGRVQKNCNNYNENSFSRLVIIVDNSACRPRQQYRDVRPGGGRAGGRGGGRGPRPGEPRLAAGQSRRN